MPSISFFQFCDDLLKRYENNKKVSMITGSNFKTQITLNLKDDYFFLSILVFGVGQHGKIDGIYYLITKCKNGMNSKKAIFTKTLITKENLNIGKKDLISIKKI